MYVNQNLCYILLEMLPLHLLPRHLYTTHGLHFNRRGKARIAEMVCKLLQTKDTRQTTPKPQKKPATDFSIIPNSITVLEADMREVMNHYGKDQTVGFAHTISADFHMSAGVAVVFRQRYGRPETSDLIDKYLAYQKVDNGPSVYGLVTKDKYFEKPTTEDYDIAFQKLQEDFMSKKLKTLVCSAMGCVRDLIQPSHFTKKIVEFQQATGATVCIVSYDQPTARRRLWNGLTHDGFIRTLKELIAEHVTDASTPQEQQQQQGVSPSSQCDVVSDDVNLSSEVNCVKASQKVKAVSVDTNPLLNLSHPSV